VGYGGRIEMHTHTHLADSQALRNKSIPASQLKVLTLTAGQQKRNPSPRRSI